MLGCKTPFTARFATKIEQIDADPLQHELLR
jgi:hypothetical protein